MMKGALGAFLFACVLALSYFDVSAIPHAIQTPPNSPLSSTHSSILIAVCTAPSHRLARAVIRKTWGARFLSATPDPHFCVKSSLNPQCTLTFSLKFFLGESDTSTEAALETEQEQYGDLVQVPWFKDTYSNLSRKTISMIAWANDNNFSHIIKVDDDTFVHAPRLSSRLYALAKLFRLDQIYAGVIHREFPVLDNSVSKWYMADQYPFHTFPEYAAGPLYFLGKQILHHLSQPATLAATNQSQGLFPYRVEDAGVGIWIDSLRHKDKVDVVVEDWPALLYKANCLDNGDILYVNPVRPQEMLVLDGLSSNVTSEGNLCITDFVTEECIHHPCLCEPSPGWCADSGQTWREFANEVYSDRLFP